MQVQAPRAPEHRPPRGSAIIAIRAKGLVCLIGTALLGISLVGAPVLSQDSEQLERALNVIANFAERMCTRVEPEGGELQLKGSVRAELPGLIGKLVDVGGELGAEAKRYEGVLQTDLVAALKDSNNCRVKIVASLQDKIVNMDRVDPPKEQQHPYETVMAGMVVRCSTDFSKLADFINSLVKDSSPASRLVAHAGLQTYVKKKFMNSPAAKEFECIFDDETYYLRVVPSDTVGNCRRYRETWASGISGGKRITEFKSTCPRASSGPVQ